MKKLILVFGILFFGFTISYSQEKEYLGDLGVVVITPTRGPRMVKDLPTNISVITKEKIEEANAQNVGEAIENEVGIYI